MDSQARVNCSFINHDGSCLKPAFATVTIVIQAIFIFIVGCTNGSLLYIFLRSHQLRNITNFLIMNLVICNLILLPVHALDLTLLIKPELGRGYRCLFLCCAIYFVVSVSSMMLLAISVDKMVKVFRPFKYEDIVTKFRAGICISVIWISASCLTVCIPFAGVNQIDNITAIQSKPCDIYDFGKVFHPTYSIFLTVIYVFVPHVALYIICARILAFLVPVIRSSKQTLQSELLRQEVRPLITISVMVITTGLAYVPITVVTWLEVYNFFTVNKALHSVITWLNYLNISVNPSLYCYRSSVFKSAWKRSNVRRYFRSNLQNGVSAFSNIFHVFSPPVVVMERRRRLSSKVFPDSIELYELERE